MLPKKPAGRPFLSVGRSARFSQRSKTQYGVPFPATGAVGTLGSGDGIGIAGTFAASSSLDLSLSSLGLGILRRVRPGDDRGGRPRGTRRAQGQRSIVRPAMMFRAAVTTAGIAARGGVGAAAAAWGGDGRRCRNRGWNGNRRRGRRAAIGRGLAAAAAPRTSGGMAGVNAIEQADSIAVTAGVATRRGCGNADAACGGRCQPGGGGDVPAQGG